MAFKECDKPGPEKFQPIFIETKKIEARIPCTVENHDKNRKKCFWPKTDQMKVGMGIKLYETIFFDLCSEKIELML